MDFIPFFKYWYLEIKQVLSGSYSPHRRFRPMICDNPYPTHCPGDNSGDVVDEYSKIPAAVGDHTPLRQRLALNGCRNPKVHNRHQHRAEDDLPAGHHGVPQQLLHPFSSLAHLSFSYSFTPKGMGSHHHRAPDTPAVPGRLRSTALSLLPQADEQELYPPLAEKAWKHASLLGKLSCCKIKAQYTWLRSWCLSVVTTVSHMHNWNTGKLVEPCREARDTPT